MPDKSISDYLQPIRPLAIGIDKQLAELGYSLNDIKAALTEHCSSRAYLEAIAAGGQRHNLDGTAARIAVRVVDRELAQAKLNGTEAEFRESHRRQLKKLRVAARAVGRAEREQKAAEAKAAEERRRQAEALAAEQARQAQAEDAAKAKGFTRVLGLKKKK